MKSSEKKILKRDLKQIRYICAVIHFLSSTFKITECQGNRYRETGNPSFNGLWDRDRNFIHTLHIIHDTSLHWNAVKLKVMVTQIDDCLTIKLDTFMNRSTDIQMLRLNLLQLLLLRNTLWLEEGLQVWLFWHVMCNFFGTVICNCLETLCHPSVIMLIIECLMPDNYYTHGKVGTTRGHISRW